MISTLAIVFIAPAALSASNAKVLWHTKNGPALTVGLIDSLTAIQFREEALRRLSPPEIRIATLAVYPTQEDWLRAKGYGGTDCMYENWRAELDRRRLSVKPLRCPEVSQAIKIGGAILVRRVDANCQATAEIVQGSTDPLDAEAAGTSYRVLDVYIQPITDDQLASKDIFAPISIFARTSQEVTIGRAKALLEYFQTVSMAPDVTVILRSDPWFVTNCEFPVLFLFEGVPLAIPSKAEVQNAKEAVCGVYRQWPVQCY